MRPEATVFARDSEFGSVTRCSHGCIHLQLGFTTMTLTEDQYIRFVALINDSAAQYEFFRGCDTSSDDAPSAGQA